MCVLESHCSDKFTKLFRSRYTNHNNLGLTAAGFQNITIYLNELKHWLAVAAEK